MERRQEEVTEEERRVEGAEETMPTVCTFLFMLIGPPLIV